MIPILPLNFAGARSCRARTRAPMSNFLLTMVLLSPFQPRKDNASMLSMQTRLAAYIGGRKTKLHGGYGTRGYLQQDVIWFQVFRRRQHEITPAILAALGGRGRAVTFHSSVGPYSFGQSARNGEKQRHQQAGCRLNMGLWGSGE